MMGSELQWWLLGFGDRVEVLKPKKLRAEFTARISRLSEMYQVQ
ncbi:WYL domain-containing protein [bacterium]|nr:WYL domain-containing protein [bacterium]